MVVSGGNIYVAGYTDSTNFPRTSGGTQPEKSDDGDAFVSLLTADLKQLVQSTYHGGTGYDETYAIAVSNGNVYVAGDTNSSNFPRSSGGAQPAFGGGSFDAFVSRLSANLKAVSGPNVFGDFDGDGKTDIGIWRPSTGYWSIIRSSDGGMTSRHWGSGNDVPKMR
jgi:hypothetical protein